MEAHIRFNPVDDDTAKHGLITEWLAEGRARAPENIAIEGGRSSCTYAALDGLSNRIANDLIRRGVKRGDRVGLCLNRSIEMVAVLIGILKTGAAYVPFDPKYPKERLSMMQEDARLRCAVVHAAHAGVFTGSSDVFSWEEIEQDLESAPSDEPAVDVSPEDTAYVIFTSGSTGRPKGIAMPHRALSNLIEWQLGRRSFRPGARVLQYSSISFDVSFQEIATTLASAGTLVLISDEERKDPRRLLERLVAGRIERLFLPYVAMRSMIEAAHVVGTHPDMLREIITAGEQLRIDDAVRGFFSRLEGAALDNQYGPSETHVITAHLLEGDPSRWPDLPPIGTPLTNNSVFILDERMQPVDIGEEGELYLAGRNLAHGYLRREEETRRVFVPNPMDIPTRPILYRSGDLGAYNENGEIKYLGRRDHQVKIRGHRVEPGEINTAAARFPGIGQCLTHALIGRSGSPRLVTWYVRQKGSAVDPAAFRRHLSDALPDYMVPSFLVEIDAIPYTPSGKVDFKALPEPVIADSRYADTACRYESETESGLASIWSELLELANIPRTADFFELGGDSLRAVTLFLGIRKRFGVDLPLATLAQAPTIAALAEVVDGKRNTDSPAEFRSLQVIQQGEDGVVPLFLIHGGQGNILIFNDLAKSLGASQPVYGFQWAGWDGMRAEKSIPEMARAYKEELLRCRPAGPYRIGGNCIGGLIAIELANLLKQEGRVVTDPLMVWDAPNLCSPRHYAKEPWRNPEALAIFERMKEELASLAGLADGAAVPAAPAARTTGWIGLIKRIPGLHRFELWVKALPKTIPIHLALWRKRAIPVDLRSTYCLRVMIAAVKRYRSPGYDGNMLYFRSFSILGRDFALPGWWDDPYLGFSELCRGRFEAHVLGGEHQHVLRAPEAGRIISEKRRKKDTK